MLTDTTSWSLILGALTPLLTAVVQQPTWSKTTRAVVGAAVAAAVGLLTALANGELGDGQTVLASIAAVLVASTAAYEGLWKRTLAPGIERATSARAGTRRR